jgi:hypothetical protein
MSINNTIVLNLCLLVLSLAGCDIINPTEEAPAYIRVNTVSFENEIDQGFPSHNITDVWVFADEQEVGIYEVPATFPVFFEGEREMLIAGGVKINGISSVRDQYPMISAFIRDRELIPGDTITINPTFRYSPATEFIKVETFEFGNSFDATAASDYDIETGPEAFEGARAAVVRMDQDTTFFEARTDPFNLINDGRPVFLELDYKNNQIFDVLIRISQAGGSPVDAYLITLSAKEDWNKIYIDLQEAISIYNGFEYQIVLQALKSPDVEVGEIFLDNMKILQR